jgi:hypothetical protein
MKSTSVMPTPSAFYRDEEPVPLAAADRRLDPEAKAACSDAVHQPQTTPAVFGDLISE